MEGMGFSAKDIKKAQAAASEKVAKDHTERDAYYEQKKHEKVANDGSTFSNRDKGWMVRSRVGRK